MLVVYASCFYSIFVLYYYVLYIYISLSYILILLQSEKDFGNAVIVFYL